MSRRAAPANATPSRSRFRIWFRPPRRRPESRDEAIDAAARERLGPLAVRVELVEGQLLDVGQPGAGALEVDEAALVEQHLAEADVAPLRVPGEEGLELFAPGLAR